MVERLRANDDLWRSASAPETANLVRRELEAFCAYPDDAHLLTGRPQIGARDAEEIGIHPRTDEPIHLGNPRLAASLKVNAHRRAERWAFVSAFKHRIASKPGGTRGGAQSVPSAEEVDDLPECNPSTLRAKGSAPTGARRSGASPEPCRFAGTHKVR